VPAVDLYSLYNLEKTIKANLGSLVFRRIRKVVAKSEDLIETVFTTVSSETGDVSSNIYGAADTLPPFSEQELDQNVVQKFTKYYFFTYDTVLRDNDNVGQVDIYGASNKYSELDLFDKMDFRFTYDKRYRVTQTPPRVDELVCGLVEPDPHGRKNPHFKFWFTCSEQFLHTWTAILYETHVALDKFGVTESEIRHTLMRGNKTCTNSYRKWLLANRADAAGINLTEAMKRFYILRTERASRDYVHVYAALILLIRYCELPCESNLPANLDGGPTPTKWDLPDGWMDALISKYEIEVVGEKEVVIEPPRHKGKRATKLVPAPKVTLEGEKMEVTLEEGSKPIQIAPKVEAATSTEPVTPANTPEDAEKWSIKFNAPSKHKVVQKVKPTPKAKVNLASFGDFPGLQS